MLLSVHVTSVLFWFCPDYELLRTLHYATGLHTLTQVARSYTLLIHTHTHAIPVYTHMHTYTHTYRHTVFGHHFSSQYLMASSLHHLHVWDLLSCTRRLYIVCHATRSSLQLTNTLYTCGSPGLKSCIIPLRIWSHYCVQSTLVQNFCSGFICTV